MSDYTPTSEEVREAYRFHGHAVDDDRYREQGREPLTDDQYDMEFDHWLAEHDREIRRQALKGIDTLMRQGAVYEDYYLDDWESGFRSGCLGIREMIEQSMGSNERQ